MARKAAPEWRYLDQNGPWMAVVNVRSSTAEWTNIKLVLLRGANGQTKGRFYTLAWNGERFAESVDLVRLQDRHPDIFAWVHRLCAGPTRLRAV